MEMYLNSSLSHQTKKEVYRIRVVLDASAKVNKTCLSDNLLPRIDCINNLMSVITKFRNEKIFHS